MSETNKQNEKNELNMEDDISALYEDNDQEGDSTIMEEYKKGYFFMFHKVLMGLH